MRGGQREGAGRKPREIPKKAVTIKFEPDVAERLKAFCQAKGKTLEEQVTDWLAKAEKREGLGV